MDSSEIALSDKLLMDAGGWKEMKEARQIHRSGKVSDASYQSGVLAGRVLHSGKELAVRMRVLSPTNLENLCPCFRAKRDGIICAHALAVGLEVLEPTAKKPLRSDGATGAVPRKQAVPLSPDWPKLVEAADADSLPIEFSYVLSPDLPSAWAKGAVLLGIETWSDGRKQMLSSLKGRSLFLEARDAAVFRELQVLSPEKVPASLSLTRDAFLRLLSVLAGHPRVSLGRDRSIAVSWRPHRPALRLRGETIAADWPGEATPLLNEDRAWVLLGDRIHPVAPGLPPEMIGLLGEGFRLDPDSLVRHREQLATWFEVDEDVWSRLPRVRPPVVLLRLEGSLNHQEARLDFRYGDTTEPADRRELRFVDGAIADRERENDAMDLLEACGFQRREPGLWVLKDKAAILRWLAYEVPRLDPDWKITVGERFLHARGQVEPVEAQFDFRGTGESWFTMEVKFSTPSGEPVSSAEIQRILQMGQRGQKLKSGRIGVVDADFIEQIRETVADTDPGQDQPGLYRIDRNQAGFLRETAEAAGIALRGGSPWDPEYEFEPLDPRLASILRPYQAEGVDWMLGLAGRGMGGILADDMGLGKTLQTLCLIHTIGGSTLVVCPSSLVSNWIAEAEKFVPDLRAVALEGPERDRVYEENTDADLFVTSYALLRRDEAKWRERGEFTTVVLDEAQHIKNPESKVARAAHRIRAAYRFALTGTPLENSVRDLWSICQFAVPGYLGNRTQFAERFEKPVDRGDERARQRLSRRLRPVILRRLKRDVAADLPEKIEQVVYCDLKPRQQAVYEQILRESRETLSEASGGRRRMLALTALLRLRQVCCDLRLLGLPDIEEREASVKGDALEELLLEAVEGNHRVLVFSQFVGMLQLLVPLLGERGLKFAYLDGSTKNRGDVVRRFQEQEDIPVFLISLKAGGVGLNLTAADTVIHVDPWWNPAVEAQATDRAHRIGQTRVVTAYKLITRNTVEEKFLALQEKKREAIEAIVDGQADLGDSGLSEDELLDLLE